MAVVKIAVDGTASVPWAVMNLYLNFVQLIWKLAHLLLDRQTMKNWASLVSSVHYGLSMLYSISQENLHREIYSLEKNVFKGMVYE